MTSPHVPRPSPWPIPCFAHQGFWKTLPEKSTLRAFTRAVEAEVPGIELDVRVVGGELRVGHDRKHALRRVAPTLREALAATARAARRRGTRRPVVNVELKERNTARMVMQTVQDACRRDGWRTSDFIVSAFTRVKTDAERRQNLPAELAIIAAESALPIALLVRDPSAVQRHIAQARALRACSLHIKRTDLTDRYVVRAHAAGLTVYAWTARSGSQAARVSVTGADGYFADLCRLWGWQDSA